MSRQNPANQVRIWHEPLFDNLELLRARYTTHAFSLHFHEEFAIGVIEQGIQEARIGRVPDVLMPAGCVVVINPGEVHTGHPGVEGGWSYRMLYPRADLLERAAWQIFERHIDIPLFPRTVIHDDVLAQQLLQLHRVLETPAIPAMEKQTRLMETMVSLVARHADPQRSLSTPAREPGGVARVREYIESNYQENVLLDDLASLVSMSAFHLLRVFKEEMRLPPHAYLLQVRINHAKRELLTGDSIASIAASTGFTDQSHLTKQFKRAVGVTPGAYRQKSKILQYSRG